MGDPWRPGTGRVYLNWVGAGRVGHLALSVDAAGQWTANRASLLWMGEGPRLEGVLRAVVTGCAGFIGSHLSERLLEDGWAISGIDSLAPTYDTTGRRARVTDLAAHRGFEFVEGDLNRIDLSHIVAEADVVFHLAARPGVRASWRDFATASDANILATQRVLDALAEHPTTTMVFASSSSVYGQVETFPVTEDRPLTPISPYGVTKASCEALVTAYTSQFDLTVTSLRYFTVYGPRQRSDMAFTRWIRSAYLGEPIRVYGDGKAIRDFTYVGDVVSATLLAAGEAPSGHRIYNVAGGNPVSLNDVFELLTELTGRELDIRHEQAALGDPKRTGGDTTRIEEELGWRSTTSLRDGLGAQVEWFRGAWSAGVA
jgi:UDP-glucuronate 4-epimerase